MQIQSAVSKLQSRVTRDLLFENSVQSGTTISDQFSEETFKEFAGLFPHRTESVVRSSEYNDWREVSKFHRLSDSEILSAVQKHSTLQRGIRFDNQTRMLVLHIPPGSKYRSTDSLSIIIELLRKCAAKPKLYQYGHEWYIFVFFSKWTETKLIEPVAQMFLGHGISLRKDDLNVCINSPIPLPLQPGFSWLNDQCHILVNRDEISIQSALAFFVSDVERCGVNPADFAQSIHTLIERGRALLKPLADCFERTGISLSAGDGFSCYTVSDIKGSERELPKRLERYELPLSKGFVRLNKRDGSFSRSSSARLRGTVDDTGHIILTEIGR